VTTTRRLVPPAPSRGSAKVTSLAAARAAADGRAAQETTNRRISATLLVVVAGLAVVGVAAIISASSTVALAVQEDQFFYVKRQLLAIGLAIPAMVITSRINYHRYRALALPFFLVTAGLLTTVLVVGERVGGARSWIDLGPISFQPSEMAKPAAILVLAVVMERKGRLLGDFWHFLAPVTAVLGVLGVLIMLEPDLGTTIVVGAVAVAVLLASQAPLRYVVGSGMGAAALAGILAFAADYRLDRFRGFLDPWSDASNTGYQLIQSYYALANGGLTGVGIGSSRARWFYLPNAHTDFIFAIIGEETGLIGGMAVIALFAVLALAGWAVASRAPDPLGRMLAVGITAWITFQALVNVGGVLGVLPITGITLPFVSYGNTALVTTMAGLGILVNIAQHGTGRRRP
jgi:cell division protein FtsW